VFRLFYSFYKLFEISSFSVYVFSLVGCVFYLLESNRKVFWPPPLPDMTALFFA